MVSIYLLLSIPDEAKAILDEIKVILGETKSIHYALNGILEEATHIPDDLSGIRDAVKS